MAKAAIDAKLDNIPPSLSLQGGPQAAGKSNTNEWPIQLEASSSGSVLTGEGSIVTTPDGSTLKMATSVKGSRLDTLGALVGVSLPRAGIYDVSALVSSGGETHELRDVKGQIGANRFAGHLRWEDQTPRPLLTGELPSQRLALGELLDRVPRPSYQTRPAGRLDQIIKLDWLKAFDAKLNLDVKQVADTPITVEKVSSSVAITNGILNALFRGQAAQAEIEGQIGLRQLENIPSVTLNTAIGRIDAGQTLKQLNLPAIIVGTVDAINVDASSSGRTLDALFEQAAITLHIKPANLSYSGKMVSKRLEVIFDRAEFAVNMNGRSRPLWPDR